MKKAQTKTLVITGIFAAIVIVLVIFSFGNRLAGKVVAEKTVKIGLIAPLTGAFSYIGQGPKNAIEMAVDEINANGGIGGRKIELIIEDSNSDGKTAVNAVQKMINVDKVDVVIGATTMEMAKIAPILEESRVPAITPCSSNPPITKGGDYVFRMVPSDEIQGKWAAYVARTILNKSKAAILYLNNDWGVGFASVAAQEFESLGGNVLAKESFDNGDKDLKTQLVKIRNKNPDIIFFLNVDEATSILGFKQMNELGIKTQTLGGAGWFSQKIWQQAGSFGDGAMFVMTHTEKAGEFGKKYTQRFNLSVTVCTPDAYDIVYVFKEAIEQADSLDKDKIKDSIYRIKMNGASGIVNFNEEGDRYPVRISLLKIENSTPTEIITRDY